MSAAVPIRYSRDNVVFGTDGSIAALYKLPMISYALLPDEDKWTWLWALAGLGLTINAHMSVYRLCKLWPVESYADQAMGMLDRRYADPTSWRAVLDRQTTKLERIKSFEPECYLRVSMSRRRASTSSKSMMRSLDSFYRNVSEAFGVGLDAPLPEEEIQLCLQDEELVFERVQRFLGGTERVDSDDIQWLCLRAPLRHCWEPTVDSNWRPDSLVRDDEHSGVIVMPDADRYARLFDARLNCRPLDHVVLSTEQGDTYQTCLALGATPVRVEFPGAQAEMMFRQVEDVDFPVDCVLHCTHMVNQEAIEEVEKAIIDADVAVEDARAGAHHPDERKMFNPELARALKTYLQSEEHPPMFNSTLSYYLSSTNKETTTSRVAALRDQFRHVRLWLPQASQEDLYYDSLPSPSGGKTRHYSEMTTVERIGMLVPMATRKVGDERGVYIGYTVVRGRPQYPVLADLRAAARDSHPPTMCAIGRQGSGKTFLSLLIGYLAAKSGSAVIDVDPKPDHNIVELFPGQSQRIVLAGDERFRGQLDPLVVSPRELREDIALSYYLDLLPIDRPGSWQTELIKAIKAVTYRDAGGGSLAVLEELRRRGPSGNDVFEALEVRSQYGLGVLGFGDGSNVRRFEDISRVTTIATAGLSLPDPDAARSSYDWHETISVATFKLIVSYVMWIATQDPSVHKYIVLDEAKFLPPTMLAKLVRMGRKHNATVMLCSQATLDPTEELKALISMYFMCGVNSMAEATRALQMIELDSDDPSLRSRIRQFEKGMCFYHDMHGRVAQMQIDAVDPHIISTLKTAPPDLEKELV